MNTKRLTAAQKEERRLSRAERKRMIADRFDRDAKAEAEVDVAAELARVDELVKKWSDGAAYLKKALARHAKRLGLQ